MNGGAHGPARTTRDLRAAAASLVLATALAAACATPPLVAAKQSCADVGAAPVYCDGAGHLVACAGDEPVVARDGIAACVRLEGTGYLATCKAATVGGPSPADLVPCRACESIAEPMELVTLRAEQCTLGELPVYDDGEPLDEAPSDVRIEDGFLAPSPDSALADEAAVLGDPPLAAPAAVLCDPFAAEVCPAGSTCDVEVDPPVCAPADAGRPDPSS